jgi:hypothetical protein
MLTHLIRLDGGKTEGFFSQPTTFRVASKVSSEHLIQKTVVPAKRIK